jgi:hypothetical protein
MATTQLYTGWQRGDDYGGIIGGERFTLATNFLNAILRERKNLGLRSISLEEIDWILKWEFGVRGENRRDAYVVDWLHKNDQVKYFTASSTNDNSVTLFRWDDGYENL